jgi:Na+-translocating ferredoxin:NAD+ oxidoreductase RnfE subunit
MLFFDISPLGGGIGIGLAVIFFLVCAAAAFVAFKMLKRTVKMAIRIVIVAVILLVAVIGGVSFLIMGYSSGAGGAKPPAVKTTK